MTQEIRSPMAATVVEFAVAAGQAVRAGDAAGRRRGDEDGARAARAEPTRACWRCWSRPGELVGEGDLLLRARRRGRAAPVPQQRRAAAAAQPRRAARRPAASCSTATRCTLDAARPEAVAQAPRRWACAPRARTSPTCATPAASSNTARSPSPRRRSRRSVDDLIRNTPADGMVTGIGSVNGALFGAEASRCVVMAYDATVLAGTQGMRNHQKTDRMLGIALEQQLPVVLFAEGGGGRPGDTDMPIVAGLHVRTFAQLRAPVRPGAGGRHRGRALLRRQRGAAGLQRRDHRHARQQHRHGRPGDGRGRRPGRLHARADRPERRAARPTA